MEELQNLTPLYNKEFYLAYLCGEDVELPIPDGNTEHYLAYLCGMDVPIPDPLYTKEFYLAYKCGMDVELPEPGPYRIDQYLAKWCGMDVEVPEPMYRIEYWLAQLANSGELKTVTGNPISVSDALAKPAESLVIEILPQQDLHGYANPWPAGGGNQLIPITVASSASSHGITMSLSADGIVSFSGTSDAPTSLIAVEFTLPAGDYAFSKNGSNISITGVGTFYAYIRDLDNSVTLAIFSQNSEDAVRTFTLSEETNVRYYFVFSESNMNISGSFKGYLRKSTVASTEYQPYSNLCPITGFTGVNIYHESAYDPDADPTYAIDWTDDAGTVYGGSLDVTSGVLTVERVKRHLVASDFTTFFDAYKQAYANNLLLSAPAKFDVNTISYVCDIFRPCTLNGRNDKVGNYAVLITDGTSCAFSSPANTLEEFQALIPNGIDFVYELATPTTIQLTPTQVDMLLGNNVLWNDVDGDMTLEYLADGPAEDIDALQILLGNRYVNNGAEDEATDREALEILLGGNTR